MQRLTPRTPVQRLALLFVLAFAIAAGFKLTPDASIETAGKTLTLEDFTGRVVGVIDGDTIEVMHNGEAERIRLYGIDCPEKGQPFGKAAKQFTSELVYGQNVTVNMLDVDRYGRIVAEITLLDGRILARELVAAGLAWWYQRYSHDWTVKELEEEAREAKRGLWAEREPIPPWEWRKHVRSSTY